MNRKLKGSDEQIAQMAANAVNASKPMGLGFLAYEPRQYTAQEMATQLEHWPALDYVGGRCVKLYLRKDAEEWSISCSTEWPHPDYQTWADTYPTYEALVASVPGLVLE